MIWWWKISKVTPMCLQITSLTLVYNVCPPPMELEWDKLLALSFLPTLRPFFRPYTGCSLHLWSFRASADKLQIGLSSGLVGQLIMRLWLINVWLRSFLVIWFVEKFPRIYRKNLVSNRAQIQWLNSLWDSTGIIGLTRAAWRLLTWFAAVSPKYVYQAEP